MPDTGSLSNPGVTLRDLIRKEAVKISERVDQVALATLTDPGDGTNVGILIDGFGAGEVTATWANVATPVVDQRLAVLVLKGGQSFFVVGVLNTSVSPGVLDHGALTGLADDDHTQYWNDSRGDAKIATHAASASAHHTRYDDSEADARIAIHAAVSSAHHSRYTDGEAIAAVGGTGNLGDYLLLAGGTMAGNIDMNSSYITGLASVIGRTSAANPLNIYSGHVGGSLTIAGGASETNGANIELYGGSHASYANNAYFDAALHTFRGVGGSPAFSIEQSVAINAYENLIMNGVTISSQGGTGTSLNLWGGPGSTGARIILFPDDNGTYDGRFYADSDYHIFRTAAGGNVLQLEDATASTRLYHPNIDFPYSGNTLLSNTTAGDFYIQNKINNEAVYIRTSVGGSQYARFAAVGNAGVYINDSTGTAITSFYDGGNVLFTGVIYGASRFQAGNDGSTSATLLRGSSTGSTGPFYTFSSTHRWNIISGGGTAIVLWTSAGNWAPGTDNAFDLGASSLRWDDIYATNSTIQTSDERVKVDLGLLDDETARQLVRAIEPMQFRLKDGGRWHWGFGASQVKAAILQHGLDPGDFGVFIDPNVNPDQYEPSAAEAELWRAKDADGKDVWRKPRGWKPREMALGLRAGELMPLAWSALQQVDKRVDEMERRLQKAGI